MIELVGVSFMFRLSFTCTVICLLDADAASISSSVNAPPRSLSDNVDLYVSRSHMCWCEVAAEEGVC